MLKAMNRRYDTDYRCIIDLARSYTPEIAITTDVIVGFPARQTKNLRLPIACRAHSFSRLHVFRYSRRPGTPAASLPKQVPKEEKTRRSRALISLGERLSREFALGLVGTEQEVLWENQDDDGIWTGHTDTYVTVHSDAPNLRSNLITSALIKENPTTPAATTKADVVAWIKAQGGLPPRSRITFGRVE